jgi:hypothetical protein
MFDFFNKTNFTGWQTIFIAVVAGIIVWLITKHHSIVTKLIGKISHKTFVPLINKIKRRIRFYNFSIYPYEITKLEDKNKNCIPLKKYEQIGLKRWNAFVENTKIIDITSKSDMKKLEKIFKEIKRDIR